VKTTGERPHLQRGLPERGVSPSGWLQTELAIGNQSTSLCIARRSGKKRPARLPPGSKAGLCSPAPKSQAAIPSQAGTSCKAGASTARSRHGQPSPSGIRGQRRHLSGVDTSFPGGPSTQTCPPSPVGHPPSRPPALQGGSRPSSRRES
jgi:hypothetical protein